MTVFIVFLIPALLFLFIQFLFLRKHFTAKSQYNIVASQNHDNYPVMSDSMFEAVLYSVMTNQQRKKDSDSSTVLISGTVVQFEDNTRHAAMPCLKVQQRYKLTYEQYHKLSHVLSDVVSMSMAAALSYSAECKEKPILQHKPSTPLPPIRNRLADIPPEQYSPRAVPQKFGRWGTSFID